MAILHPASFSVFVGVYPLSTEEEGEILRNVVLKILYLLRETISNK